MNRQNTMNQGEPSPRISMFGKLGWVVAIGLGALVFTAGFHGAADKLGVVDITAAFNKSNLKANSEQKLAAMTDARKGVLEFVNLNPLFTADQLKRFRVLSTQEKLNDAEKKELESIKSDVQLALKDNALLAQNKAPSADDVKKLDDYGNRASFTRSARQQLQEEFVQEMSAAKDSMDNSAFLLLREAVREIGKNQGFSIIFSERAAVYGGTDVTDEVQKQADKKGGK